MTYLIAWRQMIATEMERHGESFADCEGSVPKGDEWLGFMVDPGWAGGAPAPPFYLWTSKRVYFAICYDQAKAVASIPRFVSDEEPTYFGGEGGLVFPSRIT